MSLSAAASPATGLGALAATQVIYGVRDLQGPRATQAMLLAILATSAAEARSAAGARRGLGLAAVTGACGLGAELAGVRTGVPFGRYAYSAQLGPRIAGVPPLAGAAWAAMARPAWVAAGWISHAPRSRVCLAAAGVMAWDVFLDPRMVEAGFWRWERDGRYEGIPASNFLGWWLTAALAFGVAGRLDPRPPTAADDVSLGLYLWTWIGESVANAVIWRRPGVARAGGAAMGAIAVPALLRRLRGRRR